MKHELTLFYSVSNGGDGSAYPIFMESMELAEWDQDNADEGWGESCTGSIKFTSDSPITCENEIVTKHAKLFDLLDYLDYSSDNELERFIEEFFPDGKPTYKVTLGDPSSCGKYTYNLVFVDDVQVGKVWTSVENSGAALEEKLNS